MMLIKFSGAVIVVISSTLCGIYASRLVENRVKFMEQYIMFLTQAKTMINYNAVSVTEILSSVNSIPLVKPLLDKCLDGLSEGISLEKSWHRAVNSVYARKLFTESDKMLLYSFGDTFGSSDIDGEVTKTELHIALVSERLDNIRQEFASKCKLYRILGMFCGMMIALIIC